jgi:hypothetical protein
MIPADSAAGNTVVLQTFHRPAGQSRGGSRPYPFSAGLELVDDWPPLRPAWDASSRFCENERFDGGTLCPPLLAISRCFSGLIEAKPRFEADLFPAMCASLGS